jgi:hypothetical protein
MITRNSKLPITGPEADFARLVKSAIAGAFAAGVLLVGACSDGVPQIVSQAFAAPVATEVAYFPTQFPAPEGAPAPHIEAF